MILTIAAIEDPQTLATLREEIGDLEWADGRKSAGPTARKVKRNRQAVLDNPAGRKLRADLLSHVEDNAVVRAFARPRSISPPMISKSGRGDHYGAHVDNAIMRAGKGEQGETGSLRTDISFTLFLSEPEEYEGGELVVHAAGTISQIKAKAGELVLYPSTSIHEVRPVTNGERIAAVGWIESTVRDPQHRELLFDLENLRASLRASAADSTGELLVLDKSIANLLRMWSNP
ncbi:MAG: Fe2+-dependent dioxygenase [Erythrobacter sp.]